MSPCENNFAAAGEVYAPVRKRPITGRSHTRSAKRFGATAKAMLEQRRDDAFKTCIGPDAYKALKSLAKKEGKSADDLLREGVNVVLQRYGKKPIA